MSIDQPPYKTRTSAFLNKKLHEAQNVLQLRDWQIDLEVGDITPDRFQEMDKGEAAMVIYSACLKADVWISPYRCKAEDADPLFNLYHEIAHVWQYAHSEEVRCNVIAKLLRKES